MFSLSKGLIVNKLIEFSMRSQQNFKRLQNKTKIESSQGLVEYALIISLVVLLLITLLYFFGDRVELIDQAILDKIRSS